jgi:predicted lipid carrier protein YhbT
MDESRLPVPLARVALRVIPGSVLNRLTYLLIRRMQKIHPALFENLARLDAATVCIDPSDLPHRFILKFGHGPASLTISERAEYSCDAVVKGNLESLLNLLEGRIDSDMMFFSREITITGDTSVVVALRNTLDREEISLLDDITAMCGPAANPARKAMVRINKIMEGVKRSMKHAAERRHPHDPSETDAKHECARLQDEIKALKFRLAKFEVRGKRMDASAL